MVKVIVCVLLMAGCQAEDVRPQGEKILKAEKISPPLDSISTVVLVRCGNNQAKH
jgi:hypothetical protein